MKRVLVIAGLCLALLGVGVSVFLATFDADRYRPLLITQLEKALQTPVAIGRLTLTWRAGLAAQLQEVAVGDPAQPDGSLRADSVYAVVRLRPLFKKDVQVSTVTLVRPRLTLTRQPNGAIAVGGLPLPATPAAPAASSTPSTAAAMAVVISSLAIEDGSLRFRDLGSAPPLDLLLEQVDATVRNISLTHPIEFQVQLACWSDHQNVRASGHLAQLASQPKAEVEVAIQDLPLQRLAPPTAPEDPSVEGVAALTVHATASGRDWPMLAHALSGTGQLTVTDLKIRNLNVLREVFARLSMLPGVVEALEARLPESYQQKFAARDTVFEPMQVALRAEGGRLQMQPLQLASDTFQVDGGGQVRLADAAFEGQLTLRIDAPLSAAIVHSVNELQSLGNSHGELELPISVRTHPNVAVLPDLHYVASRVLASKTQDVLIELLHKALE